MLSDPDRDAVIAELRFNKRQTERRIAEHVGLSAAGVHQACARLSEKTRDQARYETCNNCGERTKLSELNGRGLCSECEPTPRSGVRGVAWNKATRKWVGRIKHQGRSLHVGLFDTVADAEAAVIAKRNELKSRNKR